MKLPSRTTKFLPILGRKNERSCCCLRKNPRKTEKENMPKVFLSIEKAKQRMIRLKRLIVARETIKAEENFPHIFFVFPLHPRLVCSSIS